MSLELSYCLNDPVNAVDLWGLCVEVGYKRIVGINKRSIWHTFIKVNYQGQTQMMGFDADHPAQIPFTLLGVSIPGGVKAESGGQDFHTVSQDSTQAMMVYNILSDIRNSSQFNWKLYNYGDHNCYDWVNAVLSAVGIKYERPLPWSH